MFVIKAAIKIRVAASQKGEIPSNASSIIIKVLPQINPRRVNKSQLCLVTLFSIYVYLTMEMLFLAIKSKNGKKAAAIYSCL